MLYTSDNRARLIILVVLLLIMIAPSNHAQPPHKPAVQFPQIAQTSSSSIEVPVQISLKPWSEKIAQLTPLQAGHWRTWKKKQAVEVKYRAWRGPLLIQAEGDSIFMQAHIRYWFKGRTRIPGLFNISASCGVNETPRQAVISVRVKFDWQTDWSLKPHVQVLPTRFLDRCQLTALNIDVTPVIDKLFNRELNKSIRKSLGELDDDLKKIHQQATNLWEHINKPIRLANSSWLVLQPTDIAVSPFIGYGEQVKTYIKVSLQPQLVHGEKPEPAAENMALRPMGRFFPRGSPLKFTISSPLDYEQISHQLSQILADHPFNIQGKKFFITEVKLTARNSLLTAKLNLAGAVPGKAEISGKLNTAALPDWLTLESLDYHFIPENGHLKILTDLLHNKIRQKLEKATNTLIRQKMASFKIQLQKFFQLALSDQIKIQFDDLQLTESSINLYSSGLFFSGTINGKLQLDFMQN